MASLILRANITERQALDDSYDAPVTGAETKRRNEQMDEARMVVMKWLFFADLKLTEWSSCSLLDYHITVAQKKHFPTGMEFTVHFWVFPDSSMPSKIIARNNQPRFSKLFHPLLFEQSC